MNGNNFNYAHIQILKNLNFFSRFVFLKTKWIRLYHLWMGTMFNCAHIQIVFSKFCFEFSICVYFLPLFTYYLGNFFRKLNLRYTKSKQRIFGFNRISHLWMGTIFNCAHIQILKTWTFFHGLFSFFNFSLHSVF